MVETENKLVCQRDTGTELTIEQRTKILSQLGLLEVQTIPVFEEATQTAAHLLEMPICILGFLEHHRHWFKSAVGLSRLGLMNQLAQERQLPSRESFCTLVVESGRILTISDTLSDPTFASSILVQRYGVRSYLGAPLIDAAGRCLGAIAVMDLEPRTFTIQQMKFLELMARWSMSEFERSQLLKTQEIGNLGSREAEFLPACVTTSTFSPPEDFSLTQVKLKLLEQLTQELRTPLTSILGMANVVGREIYGPLTNKQKEYLEIIQNSGRYLLSLVNEISQLGVTEECTRALNLTPVDIEMLCQQVLNTLEEVAKRKEQKLRLSLEPGRSRIWALDKDKVRQLLYHLISSMIQAAASGSCIRLHISQKGSSLNLLISVSHPWLGEGLIPLDPYFSNLSSANTSTPLTYEGLGNQPLLPSASSDGRESVEAELVNVSSFNRSCESLRLLLSQALVDLHSGRIDILGTPESGYRYVVSLPEMVVTSESH